MSLDIFIPVFECSYKEYDYEGDDYKAGGDGGELWDELKDYDEGEETLNNNKLNMQSCGARGIRTCLLFGGIVRGDCAAKT